MCGHLKHMRWLHRIKRRGTVLGALLAPGVVNNLGKLMGFQVCAVCNDAVQMIGSYRECPWYKKTEKYKNTAPA